MGRIGAVVGVPFLVRPESVAPLPTPAKGMEGAASAESARSAADPGAGRRFSNPKKRLPKGRLSGPGTCRPPI